MSKNCWMSLSKRTPPYALYAIATLIGLISFYMNFQIGVQSKLFYILRIPISMLELIISVDMLIINFIEPRKKNYNKYNYFVGPIRRIFASSHFNTKNLDVNAIDDNVFFDRKYSLDFCLKCNCIKQPRVTHCDICGTCILRHDHHSILLQTCIGQHNYLYYYVFVLLTVIASGLNCIVFTLFQFKKIPNDCRVLTMGFLFCNSALLFVFYERLKIMVHQLQYNFTLSEREKYLNSNRMRCQFHYDIGDLTSNVRDAFY